MAAVQPDLHKFFKSKKKGIHQGKLQSDLKQQKAVQNEFFDEKIKKSPTSENLIASSVVPDNNRLISESKKKVSYDTSRKRKFDQIEDNDSNSIKKFFQEKKTNLAMRQSSEATHAIEKTAEENIPIEIPCNEISKVPDHKQMKEQLGKCSNIHELRERLVKFKKCENKLNEFKKNTAATSKSPAKSALRIENFKSIDIEIPLSPSKSPAKTPTKSVRTPIKGIRTPKKMYCHERYAHLAAEETNLVLPFKYDIIKEAFRAVDTIVSLMHNRQEIITFAKLKPAVQEMLRKTFHEKQLAQLKAVFPLAYFFRQERLNTSLHGGKANDYHLTIGANLKYKKTAAKNLFGTPADSAEKPVFRKMDSVVMVDRRRIFHESLLKILKIRHENFLKSLDPPIELNGQDVKNWHPDFALDEIPEPEPAPLPQPPTSVACKTAKELFSKASDLMSINDRMKNALENVATKVAATEQKTTVASSVTDNSQQVTSALKGISLSLLEKIRAKEAAKAAKAMTRSPEQSVQLEMHQRLPQIANIVRNFFIAEKKAALSWGSVAAKVASSYSSVMAASDVDAHLELLVKTVPDWCTVHKVRSGLFMKIDKNREMQRILDVLQDVIKNL